MVKALTRPMVRYHGGKWKLAPWIIRHFPAHRVYVEPYGGGGSTLLRKLRSYAEVYNDLDGEMVNLFRVVRDQGPALLRAIELTPYSRADFNESFLPAPDPIEQARRTCARSYMGFGGNLTRPNRDQSPQRTGFRTYSKKDRRSIPAQDWRNFPNGLGQIIDRLRGVIIEQRDAMEVMTAHDGEETVHYVDPPYVHSTRGFDCGGTHRGYRYEMTDDQHQVLATVLHRLKGYVVLSGYDCELYRALYKDWPAVSRKSCADGARARLEYLWLSPRTEAALGRTLFS